MKGILTLLIAFVLLISSFTFSSCKDCGKKEPEPTDRGDETSTEDNSNSSSNTDNPTSNTDGPASNTDNPIPLTPQEQALDALLEGTLTKVRDRAKEAKALETRAKEDKANNDRDNVRNLQGDVEPYYTSAARLAKDVRSRMNGVERESLKAKFQEVVKTTFETAAVAGGIGELLHTMPGEEPFYDMLNMKREAQAWATATEWAVFGGEAKKAKLFADNAKKAAKIVADILPSIKDDGFHGDDAKKAAREANDAATRAANSLKGIH